RRLLARAESVQWGNLRGADPRRPQGIRGAWVMRGWQRHARLIVALFGVLFAAFAAPRPNPRDTPTASAPAPKADPGAIIETTNGRLGKFKGSRQNVEVTLERQLLYWDGTSRLFGVKIVADEKNGSRTFTVAGREGRVGSN